MNASSPRATSDALPRRWPLLFGLVCAFAYLWLFNWSESTNNPNENVRIYMTRAMAEHGTYAIGHREIVGGRQVDSGPILEEWGYVNDKALRCQDSTQTAPKCTGNLYAGKAPGLSFLGVVPLLVLRAGYSALGWGQPSRAVVVWWLRLIVVVLPTLLAWLWLARHLVRRVDDPRLGLAAVLAAALGSLSLTYGQMFAGHQPTGVALLVTFGAVVAAGSKGRPWLVVLAAFAGAWATVIEFPSGPAAALLLGWLLLRRRDWRDLGWLALGAALPVALLAHFNASAFGKPWSLPYGFLENPGFVRDIAPGLFGISFPTLEKSAGSLISPFTGLYFWAPWVLLAFLGFLASRRSYAPAAAPGESTAARPSLWLDRRGEALVASLICLYFLYFQCSHSLWRGGWVIGPRYITGLVPFAAIAVAHGLDSLSGRAKSLTCLLFGVAAAVAVAVTGLASSVSQGFPFENYNPLPEMVQPLLQNGFVARNPLMALGVSGPWSGLPYFLALLAGALWVAWLVRPRSDSPAVRNAAVAAVLAIAMLAVLGLWHVGPGRRPHTDAALRGRMEAWTPANPPGSFIPPDLPN